tara:strand:- start:207 stop:335 length:129 start_codon:yes stop_codon:yes gene_type:complete
MKNKYILYLFGIILIIAIISLYFIEIPNPSKKITEQFEIIVE